MDKDKILSALGLCQRANLLVSGEEMSLEKIKSNQAKLVILATDAGFNTTKRVTDKSKTYHVQVIDILTSDEISKAIGKANRKVIAIKDQGFAKKIKSLL
ncbi:YlxQ-related RNA-binding protein [Mycoplasmatota bacterium]|nr:YlxQ-related RNA-binding protein [Mycoplasmatota bacterium]